MKIEIDIKNSYVILGIKGSISLEVLDKIETEIVHYIKKKQNIILNFAEVNFICSLGIHLLVKSNKQLIGQKEKLVIYGVNNEIKQIFDVIEIGKILTIVDTQEQAIELINNVENRG
jgi:anti-sigma B factor antagonist